MVFDKSTVFIGIILSSVSQIDNLYRRVVPSHNVHIFEAKSELGGQNVENNGFKIKGRLDNARVFC